ncbi:Hypothetical protein NTJ_00397 [Nesidiocoris tenuis]|uniref:Uncharacterized protein n=1 Tax=Nesidiocoris tenuis TaxID=355587 RepID=A0ABN7ABG5_9HEMI|nr:Hypothetical protein NTJ_00397 [Nesidiocoris tenuis]
MCGGSRVWNSSAVVVRPETSLTTQNRTGFSASRDGGGGRDAGGGEAFRRLSVDGTSGREEAAEARERCDGEAREERGRKEKKIDKKIPALFFIKLMLHYHHLHPPRRPPGYAYSNRPRPPPPERLSRPARSHPRDRRIHSHYTIFLSELDSIYSSLANCKFPLSDGLNQSAAPPHPYPYPSNFIVKNPQVFRRFGKKKAIGFGWKNKRKIQLKKIN